MERKMWELFHLLNEYEPEAEANIQGSPQYPDLSGQVFFYPFWSGTLLLVYVKGLPFSDQPCEAKICAFHIHAGSQCSGTPENPFANAGSHYNPQNCEHPEHAGDLPLLLSNHGVAFQAVYTERFTPLEVVGRTVIIHENPDDYHTQPSGNAGMMIACGVIQKANHM